MVRYAHLLLHHGYGGRVQELFKICTDVIDGKAVDAREFPVTEETQDNIACYHRTRIPINAKWMEQVCSGLPDSQLIKLEKIPDNPRLGWSSRKLAR